MNVKLANLLSNLLLKPYVINEKLGAAYKAMAQDTKAEEKANEWVEGLIERDFYEKSWGMVVDFNPLLGGKSLR